MESRHSKREHYLKRLLSTHLRSSELRRYVELPAHLNGQSILDIGAGTSTTSMDCVDGGARLVALDLRFRNVDEVRSSSGDYFNGYKSNLADPLLKQHNPMLQVVYDSDKADSKRFFEDFVGRSRGIYVAGDLWHLPFADKSFDFVFSIRCLSDCFVDPEVFLDAVSEALRVVKPGSTVQISPWQADYLSLGRGLPIGASAKQQEQIVQLLRSRGVRCRLKTVRQSDVQVLQLSR
jgi:SAM-dependent methyltransferase